MTSVAGLCGPWRRSSSPLPVEGDGTRGRCAVAAAFGSGAGAPAAGGTAGRRWPPAAARALRRSPRRRRGRGPSPGTPTPRPPGRAEREIDSRRPPSLGWTSIGPPCSAVAYAGTMPRRSRMRAWRARKPGSRSFQCWSTGVAMKIDEYVPDAMPISSAKAKSLQRLAAEQHQREHRQQRAEGRGQRADDDLGQRAVDDLRERGARHPRDVLSDAVEHDDRVVERVTKDRQERRDRRRRHLPADQGVDAGHDQDVVHQRDQHRHGELPLEAQRDVDRDDQQRRDDRDRSRTWPRSAPKLGPISSMFGRSPARTTSSSASSTASDPPFGSSFVEIWTTC